MRHHSGEALPGERLAIGIGWFSIGLGLAEVMAPGSIARLVGLRNGNTNSLRALGAREIGNGIAILAEPGRAAWLWSRVGGDAIDLSYLLAHTDSDTSDRRRLGAAIAAVTGLTALDVLCALQLRRRRRFAEHGVRHGRRPIRVERVVTINRPIDEVYQFWRTFENFPSFMRHLESVETTDPRRSRWRAKAPAGRTIEWEAEILQDRPNEWIAWRSVEGSELDNSGSVRFERAPGARGTEVRVQLQYTPPAGALGRTIAKLFGEEPDQQIREDLIRFKQLMETGEIPISDAPNLRRPAQPPANPAELRTLGGVPS